MRPALYCIVFALLATAGWSASGSFESTGFTWLATDSTSTDTTTDTSTTTSTDTTSTDSSTTTPADNPPSFANIPGDVVVEANGSGGSVVTYVLPTATDDNDGLRPVDCSPDSGSTFPLGQTTVACTSSDSAGNTGHASFSVTVQDTTPPTLVVPSPHTVYATSALGIGDSDAAVIAFVGAASATDIVDPSPGVGSDLHSFLPVGTTVIRFFAQDFSGNNVSRDVALTVLPQPPAGTPPLPPPVVAAAPSNVVNLSIATLDGVLRLNWQLPPGADHVQVTRSASDGSAEAVVYSGTASSFTDYGLQNGTEYRYVVRSVDAAGNRSAGVAIVGVPRRNMLRAPRDGAQLKKPPKLAWADELGASYYNLQLFRNGTRIFVSWPKTTSFALRKAWRYQARKYALSRGRYDWYVWPGFGPRKDVNYGVLLGVRSFRIVR